METTEENTIIEVPANTPKPINQYDKLIDVAFSEKADLEKLEKLFELKEKYEANEARKAFHVAMAEFKKQPIKITKDKINIQYNSSYTTIGNLINTVAPKMGECGISHKWNVNQSPNLIAVSCVVTHKLGYSDSVTMHAPPDKTGDKNTIQQIKSTRTYLQAATFESIMGLASTDTNLDDDGNGAGKKTVNSLVKLSSEHETLQEVRKLFPKEYQSMIQAFGGEPVNNIGYKRANDYINSLVSQKDNN